MFDAERIFALANTAVLPAWILLAVAPGWRRTQPFVTATQLSLAGLYTVLFFRQFVNSSGDFSTLASVAKLFENPWVLLGGWVHYLVFDLFVGAWEARDAMRHRLPRWILAPCLALTLMLGPLGLLAYSLARRPRAGWLPDGEIAVPLPAGAESRRSP